MIEAESPEIWGGAEYTCNRVGDSYFDQMICSGHATRLSDFEEFASLGIKTLRFGLLWERHELDPSWGWGDSRLGLLRQLGVRPIVNFVHHGSGPPHTDLLDPEFPAKLAAYAGSVAERYPWVDAYTPVNEPHTTARFSAMYGMWYPHHRSRASYLRALLNQLKGTVLSMRAVRRINPRAQLIQTEDVGRIWSTAELQAERDLFDHRRWLPFDLLHGSVDRHHPLYRYLLNSGLREAEVLWFQDNPCRPDVLGINYYLTSDRFLDHRVECYPADRISSEGPYADVEAVRACPEGIAGFESLILEAWERYQSPVAVTEVHLGDSSDQQIKWLIEAWDGAVAARRKGADCVAITVWALLGSFNWNVLVTHENGRYEPGVFDVSGGIPVRTPLAEVVSQMARGERSVDRFSASAGWWRQPQRIAYHFPDSAQQVDAMSEFAA